MMNSWPRERTYRGSRVSLLTQHGKERLLAPLLESAIACSVLHVSGFDTDLLGTFTRDIPRDGTQREAARRKAQIGMELSGCSIGIASEGSFATDPVSGMLPWNREIVLWVDAEAGLEVCGSAHGPARLVQETVDTLDALRRVAVAAGFPAQQLVLRPDDASHIVHHKGLADPLSLQAAFEASMAASTTGRVFVESDLRAHANPARQEMIRRAGEDLVARLCSICPCCGAPGFWSVDLVPGLPCADCGLPTAVPVADIVGCLACDHRERRPRPGPAEADPARCDYCNP